MLEMSLNNRINGLFLLFGSLLAPYHLVVGSPLKADEQVLFFPSSASQLAEGLWQVPLHHWVFEKEQNSIGRKFSQAIFSELIEGFDVSEEKANSTLFRDRLAWFLVDNERNKKINIELTDQKHELQLTEANGHGLSDIKFNSKAQAGSWVSYKLLNQGEVKNDFSGELQLIPETGVTVISDIDDTIKISNVLDKKALIRNTFVEPYKVAEGMPAYYQSLDKQGTYFHYVSASPWQVYPSLKPFMDSHYPKGTVSLRYFRLTDSSLINFLQPSTEYKIAQIKKIIQRYPKHQFILIGDSGEHDPEVYASIYRQFSDSIKSIQIRAITGSDLSDKRFSDDFKGIPKSVWEVFGVPDKM